jgi:clan AA aspartic protease (TIGR02281 family)
MSRRTVLMTETRVPSEPPSKIWWLVVVLLLVIVLPDHGWRHQIIESLRNAIGAFENRQTAEATLAPHGESSAAVAPQLEVPVDADNRCMVDLTLNGIGPFRFIVDTGAPGVILTASMGKRLGIDLRKRAPDHDSGGWGGGSTNGVYVRLKELRLKSFRLQDFDIAVENEKQFHEGLLGITFISQLRRFEVHNGQCRFWW